MDLASGIILGIVQGLTEFLPISSSGHLIIAREVFSIDMTNDLAVDAILQLATVLAVLLYFWSDLTKLLRDACTVLFYVFFKSIPISTVPDERKIMLFSIMLGTIPAALFGYYLEDIMATSFRNPALVAVMLIVGSMLFIIAEQRATQSKQLTVKSGVIIGLFQCLALIPGMSRSGATISGGLLMGMTRESATRFSFLLSFPIILGSGVKKLTDMLTIEGQLFFTPSLLISFVLAFTVGLASIHFLIRYLRNHSLTLFAVYRLLFAFLIFTYLSLQ